MKIDIADQKFQEAAQEAIISGITDAMTDWEVKRKLREAVSTVVARSGWSECVARAVNAVDVDDLTKEMAEHFASVLSAGMRLVMVESMAAVLVDSRVGRARSYISAEELEKLRGKMVEVLNAQADEAAERQRESFDEALHEALNDS